MSLRQLRYFVAVARAGSFTAAAARLHVSQPAVGLQVKFLEERLGVSLLERHSRGVQVTEAGQGFLTHAERILDLVQEAERSVATFRARQPVTLSLGITPTLGRTILAELLYKTGRRDAPIRISFHEGISDELYGKLAAGELDAAFCYDPPPDPEVEVVPLYAEDLCLIGPPEVIGSGPEPVDFRALDGLPLVLSSRPNGLREKIETAATSVGVALNTLVELDLIALKREFLLRYAYCTICPYGLFLADIRSGQINGRPIVGPALTRTMCIALSRKLPPAAAGSLLEIARPLVEAEIARNELHWRPLRG